jgi:hypothetical protein
MVVLGLICVEIFFNVLNVRLNCRRWFELCLIHIPYCVLVLVSGERDERCRLGPGEVPPEDGDDPVSETLCVLNKNRTVDNIQKHSICIMDLVQLCNGFPDSVLLD